MDMLRFHKFTIGWNWIADYGSSDNAEEFKALLRLLAAAQREDRDRSIRRRSSRPPITTIGSSPRIRSSTPPTMQAKASKETPILIRVETTSGHGASNVTKQIESTADIYAFIMYEMGLTPRFGTN